MSTGNLRLAQWLPRDLPIAGDTVAVTQPSPLETEFTTAAFPEAPLDGRQYGRQSEGWTLVPPLPFASDAPSDGNRYGRRNAAWSVIPNPEPDAPADGKDYARRNNAWMNLDAYATDAEVAAAIAANAIPDAPNDGKQYGRQNKAWTVASTVFEAPADGKQYARKDSAWAVVAPANSIAVDDNPPANPKYGDRWIRPSDGQDATWVPNGAAPAGTWIDTDSASMFTSPVLLQDGTLAAPGLAWANELGMGWYRPGAGKTVYAVGGANALSMDFSTANNSFMSMTSRAVGGQATFAVANNPNPNSNSLLLTASATGLAIDQFLAGTAAALPLNINNTVEVLMNTPGVAIKSNTALLKLNQLGTAESHIEFQRNGVVRWYMACPTADSNGNDWALVRCDDAGQFLSTCIYADRQNGLVNIPLLEGTNINAITSLGIGPSGAGSTYWRVVKEGSVVRQYINNAVNLRFENDIATGTWSIVNQTGSFNFTNGASFWTPQPGTNTTEARCGIGGVGGLHLYQNTGNSRTIFFNSNSALAFDNSNGNLQWSVNGQEYFRVEGPTRNFLVISPGHGYQDSAEPWRNYNSDARLKQNVGDYTKGLAELLAMQVRTYHFTEASMLATDVERVGFIAQELEEIGLPEMVVPSPMAEAVGIEDLKTITLANLQYMTVNAIKELHARIAALEAA